MSELLNKDKQYVWHPFTQHLTAGDPLEIVRANGSLLFDPRGKSYIDANSSWWVNVHGHGHPHIAKAMSDQFNTIDHVVFAGVTHAKAVELAERITSTLPDHFQKVFFSDNGSTAVEVALKMTFQYWFNQDEERTRVLAIQGAYHGDTFGAMSVGQRGYFNKPFEHFFFDVDYLDFPNETNQDQLLNEAETLFSSGEFACMIVEPLVQGAAGMKMYSAEFLDKLVLLARKYGVLVIFDEVMTGFGRTGKMYAMDHCQHKPDIVTLSKGLTAGVMALGLTVTSDRIYEAFLSDDTTRALLHGHSFTANPIACAVACANLDIFDAKETWGGIDQIVAWNQEFFSELEQFNSISNLRLQGTILAFEITVGGENNYFSNIRSKAYAHFLDKGILIRPLGNTIFINPPYCLTKTEYDQIKDGIISFLELIQE